MSKNITITEEELKQFEHLESIVAFVYAMLISSDGSYVPMSTDRYERVAVIRQAMQSGTLAERLCIAEAAMQYNTIASALQHP